MSEPSWIARLDTRSTRLVAVAVLLVGLAGTCVGFATLEPDPAANRFPDSTDILADADAYLGERVEVSGRVVGTDPVRIVEDYTTVRDGAVVSGTVAFTVTGVATAPDRGDSLQVFGTLTDTRRVRATNTVVVPGRNFLYMYAVSFFAGLWVLGRLIRGWQLDWRRLALRPRSGPLDPGSLLPWTDDEEEPTDA